MKLIIFVSRKHALHLNVNEKTATSNFLWFNPGLGAKLAKINAILVTLKQTRAGKIGFFQL